MASIDFAKRPGGFNNKRRATHLVDRRFLPRVTEFVQVCANKPTVEEIVDYLQESFQEYSRKKRGALRQYVIKALALDTTGRFSSKATELENNYMEKRQKRLKSEWKEEEEQEEDEEVCNESDDSIGNEEELVDYKDSNLINNSLKNMYKNVASNKDKVLSSPRSGRSQIIDLTENTTAMNPASTSVLQSPRRSDVQRSPTKTISGLTRTAVHASLRSHSAQTIPKNGEPTSPRQQGGQLFNKAISQLQVFSKKTPTKGIPSKSKINIHASLLDERMHNGMGVPQENDYCLEAKPDIGLTRVENGNHGLLARVENGTHLPLVNEEKVNMKSVILSSTQNVPLIDDSNVSIPVTNKNLVSIPKDGRNASSRSSTPVDKGKISKKKGEQTKEGKKRFEPVVSTKTFKDVGGYESCIQEVSKLLLHLKHPEVFTTIGIKPPRGFLLHGPPGCGKTLLANAIAGELSIPFFNVAAPEIVSGISGDSEQRVRSLFAEALAVAPSIIFIDEIDSITPKREEAGKEMERRIVTQILTCMDGLAESDSHVLVIGATNRPDSLDPALRRAGRFDREIAMGIPDRASRKIILEVICSGLRLSPDFDFETIAVKTPGFVGADMEALKREAAICAVDSVFKLLEEQQADFTITRPTIKTFGETSSYKDTNTTAWLRDEPPLSEDQLASLYISTQHFEDALPHVQPSAKREGFATVPDVTWDDIGALEDIREELTMAIMAPVQNPEEFESLGLVTPPGILLCGPPGCGKTLLAKAVANEAGINFISVKGPELLNMYVGESEKAVRQVFQRARCSSPCVIFFDEIDALCPKRSQTGDSSVTSRVVNQLLTEMDGLESRKSVFIMGATNRPDILDRAILRPGRIDKQLYVGLPNSVDRCKILRTITKNGTKPSLSPDIDIEELASDVRCEGFSGADLSALVREASIAALKDFMRRRNGVSEDDEENIDGNVSNIPSNVSSAEKDEALETIAACQPEPDNTSGDSEQSQSEEVMEDSSNGPPTLLLRGAPENLPTCNEINGDEESISSDDPKQDAAVSENNSLQSHSTPNVKESKTPNIEIIVPETATTEEDKTETMDINDLITSNGDAAANITEVDQTIEEAEEKTKTIMEIDRAISLNADSPAITDFHISSVNKEKDVESTVNISDSISLNVESPASADFQIGTIDCENHVAHIIDTSVEEIEEDTLCNTDIDSEASPTKILTLTDSINNSPNQATIIVNPIPLSIIAGPSHTNSIQKKIIVTKRHFSLAFQKVQPSVSEKDRRWYEKLKKGDR